TPAPVPPVTGPVGESLLADAAVDGRSTGDGAAATSPPVSRTVAAGEGAENHAGRSPDTGTGTDNDRRPAETTDARAPPSSGDGGSAPVTAWSQLPLTYRAQVPTFAINVHVYAPEPARRFVMVDMKRYREGDTLPVGPRVESITSDGLVLAWRGRRFLWPVDGPPR
ncbi:general secretion pathway protein GspB, partial [Arhodomonas sp. KWT]